jgi:hypothetical protein
MRAADLITKDAQHTVIMHAQRGRDNSFETSQDPRANAAGEDTGHHGNPSGKRDSWGRDSYPNEELSICEELRSKANPHPMSWKINIDDNILPG